MRRLIPQVVIVLAVAYAVVVIGVQVGQRTLLAMLLGGMAGSGVYVLASKRNKLKMPSVLVGLRNHAATFVGRYPATVKFCTLSGLVLCGAFIGLAAGTVVGMTCLDNLRQQDAQITSMFLGIALGGTAGFGAYELATRRLDKQANPPERLRALAAKRRKLDRRRRHLWRP